MKKKVFYRELAYPLGLILIAFSGAMTAKADLGMSMVVAPAYILHLKMSQFLPWFTFGVAAYTFQGLLILLLFAVMKKFKVSYLLSFITAILYGVIVDIATGVLSGLPTDTLPLRLLWYAIGTVSCSLAVSLFFHTYLPPEAYELMVKELSRKFGWKIHRVKTAYDLISLTLGVVLSFCFFGWFVFEGVKWGTLLCALFNGFLIGRFNTLLEHFFEFRNKWDLERYF